MANSPQNGNPSDSNVPLADGGATVQDQPMSHNERAERSLISALNQISNVTHVGIDTDRHPARVSVTLGTGVDSLPAGVRERFDQFNADIREVSHDEDGRLSFSVTVGGDWSDYGSKKIGKHGNSACLILEQEHLAQMQLGRGDYVRVEVREGQARFTSIAHGF